MKKAHLAFYQLGTNLIEILMTLVLISILLGFVAPTYQHMIEKQAQLAELARLEALFNHARLIASYNDKDLRVCASHTGEECNSGAYLEGNLLLLTLDTNQLVHFSRGSGYPVILPEAELTIRPLPKRGAGGSILPCTGFSQIKPKGITLSSAGRVRINDDLTANLIAKCPK